MAAGLVNHLLTTSVGVSFNLRSWVPDTAAPDANALPVMVPLNSAGTPLATGSGVNGVDVPRMSLVTDQAILSMVQDTSKLANGNSATLLIPKFAKIAASVSGINEVVAAVASKKIRVIAWDAKVNAAVNFKWTSGATPTDLSGLYYNSAQGDGVARAFCPVGYFETASGEALNLNLSAAVAVGGSLVYIEV